MLDQAYMLLCVHKGARLIVNIVLMFVQHLLWQFNILRPNFFSIKYIKHI